METAAVEARRGGTAPRCRPRAAAAGVHAAHAVSGVPEPGHPQRPRLAVADRGTPRRPQAARARGDDAPADVRDVPAGGADPVQAEPREGCVAARRPGAHRRGVRAAVRAGPEAGTGREAPDALQR
ncbi:hypothetical protein SGPA1_20778 [Streptomyces misionensis JCM 4497]